MRKSLHSFSDMLSAKKGWDRMALETERYCSVSVVVAATLFFFFSNKREVDPSPFPFL